jgi:hypothetical protein
MPEFHKGTMVDRWIIVSTEHGRHPSYVQLQPKIQHLDVSPYHPRHEALPPPEVLADRTRQTAPNSPDWTAHAGSNEHSAFFQQLRLGSRRDRRQHGRNTRLR